MPSGSRPLAGSSRIRTSGSPSSAWAKPRRWRMPSEYWPTRWRAAVSSRPTSSSSASTRCAGTPMVWAETASASRPRRPACWADASSRVPTRRPGFGRSRWRPPRTWAWPLSGSERPTSIRIVVVLPAPLGPRKPVTVPGSQRNVTSETTVRPPRCLVSAWVSIMAADSRPAGFATTVRGLRSPSPSAVAGSDFGRGSRPPRWPSLDPRAMARQATARFTDGRSGWFRSALPGVVIEARDEERGRRDRVVDAAVYLGAFAIGAATLAGTWEMHSAWLRVVAVVVGIATLVSLHWRRTHPAAVGIGVGAVSLVILPASGANLAATFNAAIRARGRDLAVIAALLIAWAFASPLLVGYPAGNYWLNAGACLLLTGVVLGWGLFVRARRELVRSLRAQADRAADDARAAERRRIAREMHDVLAHRLSLLSVHAGALEFHPDAPAEEVAEAAGVIRQSAKTALEELRGVIGVLREDSGESLTQAPQPTLADLAALVEESRGAGMRITARIELGDAAPPAAVGRTAYRIAQEGLTNARKHAPGAAATLTVRAPDGDLQVEVRSLAPVAVAAAAPLPGAGTGLIGLAERVSLAGGKLEHGIDPDGAFVLRASLPR